MSSAWLTTDEIDVPGLIRDVTGTHRGAISIFLGTVRDMNDGRPVTGIDYSAYEAMAVAEMNRIVAEAEELHTGIAIAVAHRTGTLRVGEVSVAIASSHAHRGDALDATRYVIEELKRRVPIWKREHYTDGPSEWVDPRRKPQESAR